MTHRTETVRLHRGNSLRLDIDVEDESGTPFDLTTVALKYWVAKTPTSDPVIQKTKDDGIETTDHVARVQLVPEDTEDLVPGRWYHELEVVDGLGRVFTAFTGDLWIDEVLIE